MPQPSLPLILSLGPDHQIVDPRNNRETVIDSFVGGLTEHAALVGGVTFAGTQIDLTPAGAWRMLGGAVADLGQETVHVAELFGRNARVLQERVRQAPDWAARIALVDTWLASRVTEGDGLAPELSRAWEVLFASDGRARIGAVARDIGWSPRHLSRRFSAAFGIGPKQAARIVRLDRAWTSIRAETSVDLAHVAVAHGYADQSHFTNEVREMTGFTPTTLIAGQRDLLSSMVSDSSKTSTE